MTHCNRWFLCAAGHPLATGCRESALRSKLVDARRKLKRSDGTLGSLVSMYFTQSPPEFPESPVGSFCVFEFQDDKLIRWNTEEA